MTTRNDEDEAVVYDACDESKCRSIGSSGDDLFHRFDCYATFPEEPLLCADGYDGRIINTVPKREDVIVVGGYNISRTQLYYTCCPAAKGYNINSNITITSSRRHCSDPIVMQDALLTVDNNNCLEKFTDTTIINDGGTNSSMPCNDERNRKYPRKMATSIFYPKLYVCCDSSINETNTPIIEYCNGDSLLPMDYSDEEEEEEMMKNAFTGVCDESKCISDSVYNSNGMYSCWGSGPGTLFPYSCDDGYVGRKIDGPEQYQIWSMFIFGSNTHFGLSYYTCCPPDYPIESPAHRHCSDGQTTKCDSSSYLNYSRDMRPIYDNLDDKTDAYVCCDSPMINNTTTNFLDVAECVPICSEQDLLYCIGHNIYGRLQPMTCTYDEIFQYPHILHQQTLEFNDSISEDITLFDCCKTKTGDGPFIKDFRFNTSVWPQLVVSSIAFISSAILVMGLSLSMLRIKKLRRGEGLPAGGGIRRPIPDLMLNIFIIILYGSYVNQYYSHEHAGYIVLSFRQNAVDVPLDYAWIFGCSTANIWMNAVVAYEVFDLLKKSHQGERVKPPTIKKATIQGMTVYLYALIIFLAHFFLDGKIDMTIAAPIYFMISAGFPIVYLCCICTIIWYRGLVPSLGGRLRELSLYFFRIIVVFLVFWLPAISLMVISGYVRSRDIRDYVENPSSYINPKLFPIGLLICSIQAIVSTGMALTKTDVRKHVLDLLSLSYCRRRREEGQENLRRDDEHR
ncbi:hypothetical protein FRACYDRAFT_257659 [Fragilariopsis cylindrus CCMP1102]|uniref:Uncharacterized protein n=1 Tax=Fragilariopsis cylindrus CCMP1102 TaxID=635003 RepID=A0A1E7EJ02_9STRA|nr:hypothetical protein FRACYDRAFT_257659 [Fragilariopsis cylindrus CCMP1102]|eukprot:OEU05879.1 hypothetical protein FRACYDRAFT_257659 [Fragilariopsis cylindrus CCMP1102]